MTGEYRVIISKTVPYTQVYFIYAPYNSGSNSSSSNNTPTTITTTTTITYLFVKNAPQSVKE